MDYRELNNLITKDVYPLPLIEEVQHRLAGASIFTKLDLQSGVPVDVNDQEKMAFSGMGSYEFTRMPCGTFPRLLCSSLTPQLLPNSTPPSLYSLDTLQITAGTDETSVHGEKGQ